jgi:hypothetical protein
MELIIAAPDRVLQSYEFLLILTELIISVVTVPISNILKLKKWEQMNPEWANALFTRVVR